MEANRYEIILKQIESAQREAAALMLQARGILAETKTGRRDVVTEYDRRVQTLLMERLTAASRLYSDVTTMPSATMRR